MNETRRASEKKKTVRSDSPDLGIPTSLLASKLARL